jgi:hypothetical protein
MGMWGVIKNEAIEKGSNGEKGAVQQWDFFIFVC